MILRANGQCILLLPLCPKVPLDIDRPACQRPSWEKNLSCSIGIRQMPIEEELVADHRKNDKMWTRINLLRKLHALETGFFSLVTVVASGHKLVPGPNILFRDGGSKITGYWHTGGVLFGSLCKSQIELPCHTISLSVERGEIGISF